MTIFLNDPSTLTTIILKIFSIFRLTKLAYANDTKRIRACSNLTLINSMLVLFGPMREDTLTKTLMILQAGGTLLAFAIRYGATSLFYGPERR